MSKKIKFNNENEKEYYELVLDVLADGAISDKERKILDKHKTKYSISDEKAQALESMVNAEIKKSKQPKLNSDEEKKYYELLTDCVNDDGSISEEERTLLELRRKKFGLTEERAKEIEATLISLAKSNNNNAGSQVDKVKEEVNKLFFENKREEAIELLNKEIAKNKNSAELYRVLGMYYRYTGDYEEVIKACKKSLELDPNVAYVWNNLGNAYYNLQNYDEAIKAYKISLDLDPNVAGVWSNLGNVYYFCLEDYDEAIKAYKRSLDLDPNVAYVWNNIGFCYYNLGDKENAIICYRRTLEIDPNNELALGNLQFLSNNTSAIVSELASTAKGIGNFLGGAIKGTVNYLKENPEIVKGAIGIGATLLGAKIKNDNNKNNG